MHQSTIFKIYLSTSPTEPSMSEGFGGPDWWALQCGVNPSDISAPPVSPLLIDQAQRIAMCLLLANSSSGRNKNLCFVNALFQLLRYIPHFRYNDFNNYIYIYLVDCFCLSKHIYNFFHKSKK